jgi:hypothetical protein
MEALKTVATRLNDAHLVQKFQSFCGLDRVNVVEQARVPGSPTRLELRGKNKTFLKGDKGIDSIFSAVDRDSRFISQDELVNRHIQHIKDHEPSSSRASSPDAPPSTNGRILARSSRTVTDHPSSVRDEGMTRSESAPDFIIHSKALYYLFRFGSSLGYEAFYATFFPLWTWNIDGAVCHWEIISEEVNLSKLLFTDVW